MIQLKKLFRAAMVAGSSLVLFPGPLYSDEPKPILPTPPASARPAVGSAKDRGKLVPGLRAAGLPPVLVEGPDLTKLPWVLRNGAKEFHLRASHLRREFIPGFFVDVWGFNRQMPGPTIEAVEGDRVRIIVQNDLPESTAIHWHGLEVPFEQDGVPHLGQDSIAPGHSKTYEFDLNQNGTFFYHSHDGMQDGMGMVGFFIIHPKEAYEPRVDRDIALVVQEWAFQPGNSIPSTVAMEFNVFTINGRSAPMTTPIVLKQGERVRFRILNFSAGSPEGKAV